MQVNNVIQKQEVIIKEKIKEQKKNELEVKLGLNFFSKIGVILIFLGIITVLGYAYSMSVPNGVKSIVAYILGGAITLGSIIYYNKRMDVVSQSVTGCFYI